MLSRLVGNESTTAASATVNFSNAGFTWTGGQLNGVGTLNNAGLMVLTTGGLLLLTRPQGARLKARAVGLYSLGVLAGGLTMLSFNIPLVTYLKEVDSIVNLKDVLAGMVKTPVFAVLIAGIGSLYPIKQYGTGVVILGLTLLNAVIGLRQEGKAAAAVSFGLLPTRLISRAAPDAPRKCAT